MLSLELWAKFWCPHCDKVNWICNGTEETLTLEGFTCWKCKTPIPLLDELYLSHEDAGEDEQCYEPGLKKPLLD